MMSSFPKYIALLLATECDLKVLLMKMFYFFGRIDLPSLCVFIPVKYPLTWANEPFLAKEKFIVELLPFSAVVIFTLIHDFSEVHSSED